MKFIFSVLVAVFLVLSAVALNKLPPWINKCSRGPTFNECAKKTAQETFNHVFNGYSALHVPSLNPFKIDKVGLEGSSNLKLFGSDLQIYGFNTAVLETFDWNFEEKIIKLRIILEKTNILGTYNMAGHILIMNLNGSGPMNITFYDQHFDVQVKYKLEEINNKEYVKLTNFDVQIYNGNCNLEFGNLLNNPDISKQMNIFLNENWRLIIIELEPSIIEVIKSVVLEILNYITLRIPFEELFES